MRMGELPETGEELVEFGKIGRAWTITRACEAFHKLPSEVIHELDNDTEEEPLLLVALSLLGAEAAFNVWRRNNTAEMARWEKDPAFKLLKEMTFGDVGLCFADEVIPPAEEPASEG